MLNLKRILHRQLCFIQGVFDMFWLILHTDPPKASRFQSIQGLCASRGSNISHENPWLEDEFPFWEGLFSGAFAVSFRECTKPCREFAGQTTLLIY